MVVPNLEHCHLEKVEAELAVQYFAYINASKAIQVGSCNQAEENLEFERQLYNANNEKTRLNARLEEEAKTTFVACLESVRGSNNTIAQSHEAVDPSGLELCLVVELEKENSPYGCL